MTRNKLCLVQSNCNCTSERKGSGGVPWWEWDLVHGSSYLCRIFCRELSGRHCPEVYALPSAACNSESPNLMRNINVRQNALYVEKSKLVSQERRLVSLFPYAQRLCPGLQGDALLTAMFASYKVCALTNNNTWNLSLLQSQLWGLSWFRLCSGNSNPWSEQPVFLYGRQY